MRKIAVVFAIFLFTSLATMAQTTIKGKITDAKDGAPLVGATVTISGTNKGASTGLDGTFALDMKKSETSLDVSAVGYLTKNLKIKSGDDVNVALVLDTKSLNEVVVTGVGTATSRKKVAIAVQSLGADKLPVVPAASIDQALVGKIAGAQITSVSGNPGAPVSIQFRGINTIQAGTQPMILLDGVEIRVALSSLDLNTIERVEVVQGAAAGTQYGAQGANGVIQLFSKKGKQGAVHIDLSSRVSFDNYINVGDVHKPFNHSFAVNGNGDITQGGTSDLLTQDAYGVWGQAVWENGPDAQNNKPYKNNTQYYDHFKQLFRQAKTTNNSVSITGGKEKLDYAISASQLKQESILDGELKRANFTTNIGFEIFKNFKIRSVNQFIYSDNTTGNNDIGAALYTYPFASFTYKDQDGNSTYKFGGAGANNSNPYYYRQYRKFSDKNVSFIPSINLNYKFPKFVELDYKYTIQQNRQDFSRTALNQSLNKANIANNDASWYVGESLRGGIINQISRFTTQNSLITANIKFDFDKDFNLGIPLTSTTTALYDWRKEQPNSTTNVYTGLPLFAANANQAEVKAVQKVNEEIFVTFGTFINQRFDYGDIFGISGGYRSDYSSRFGQTGKPQGFWRGDGYFRPSSFSFWNPLSNWFPEFKIRAAHGEAGIQPGFADRQILFQNYNYPDGASFTSTDVKGNPDLVVEGSKETEIGADLSFTPGKVKWFSSVNVNATYWKRRGVNVIWQIPLPISGGSSSVKFNAVDLSSKGFEFLIDANIYKSKNWNWNLNIVFGTSQSKVDNIFGTPDIPLVWSSAATYTLRPGQNIGTIFGYKALTSVDEVDPDGNRYIDKADVGLYEIVDGRVVEKDSKRVQFTPDKRLLGNTTPKFSMSFTNSVSYRNIATLSFQFDWIAKALQYNQTKEWMYSEGLHSDYDKPVTINGQTGAWTAYYRSFYDAVESNGTKDFFLEKSSFLRLRNVSLAVDIAKVVKIPFTSKMQLVVSGRNLLTFTKYTGFDPESNQNTSGTGTISNNQTSVQRGLDYFSYPNTKSVQIGLNIGIN